MSCSALRQQGGAGSYLKLMYPALLTPQEEILHFLRSERGGEVDWGRAGGEEGGETVVGI